MNTNWLLIVSDLTYGVRYHGPFFTKDAAYHYAEDFLLNNEIHWVAPMTIERVEDQDENPYPRHSMPD